MERLNEDQIKSEQVARKLTTVARTYGSLGSIQPHEVSGGRICVDVTSAGTFQSLASKMTQNKSGPETKITHADEMVRNEEGMEGGGEGLDILWKAYVSNTTRPKQ